MKSQSCSAFAVLWLLMSVFNNVSAQVYPVKPIRWIIPFPAGGTGDVVVRTVAAPMMKSLGQTVIPDFRPGGGTVIGTELVARAPADGHTLLFVANSFTINPATRPKLPYDTLRDFAGITRIVTTPYIFAVHPSLPAKSLKDVLALARARPGEVTYGTALLGGGQHLATEMLKQLAKVDLLHVPFQGVAPAMTAVVGGHVSVLVVNVPDVVPYAAAGRLRPLAVTSPSRSPALKDVPTVAELGFPGYDFQLWIGAVMLRAAPREAVTRLNTEIVRALDTREVRDALDKLGFTSAPLNPEQFDAYLRAEIQLNQKIAQQANIRIE
jgi:tripartite-type tricarboxylate transporter receptor subunit TctC